MAVNGECRNNYSLLTHAMLCNDIYGNVGGDWTGVIAGDLGMNGNMSEDPLFCGSGEYVYHLQPGSPCAPSGNQSGCLIGASVAGCINTVGVPGGDEQASGLVRHWLSQNKPNPFNPVTNVGFSLAAREWVKLEIFDAAGRRVKVLLDEEMPAGMNEVRWNGTTDSGEKAASGVYFYRLQADSFREMRRMTLVR
jgi:hypothetical protein